MASEPRVRVTPPMTLVLEVRVLLVKVSVVDGKTTATPPCCKVPVEMLNALLERVRTGSVPLRS